MRWVKQRISRRFPHPEDRSEGYYTTLFYICKEVTKIFLFFLSFLYRNFG